MGFGEKRPSAQHDDDGAHHKRPRQVRSCIPCRDRKVGCDKTQPCTSCRRYKQPQNCVYLADDGNAVASPAATTQGHPAIDLEPHLPPDRSRWFASGSSSSSVHANGADAAKPSNVFARGRLAAKPTKVMYYIGPTAWSVPAPFDVFHDQAVFRAIDPRWKRILGLSSAYGSKPYDLILDPNPQASDNGPPLESLLPGDAECRLSVEAFFDSMNQIFTVLDRPRFAAALQKFFDDRTSQTPAWVGLLTAVVAAGTAFRSFTVAEGPLSALTRQSHDLETLVHTRALAFATITYRAPLETFQTVLVLILLKKIRFGWTDGSNGTSGLLGLANRLVFSLGLHRDPSHALSPIPPEEASLRRKLFYVYLYLDYEHSLQCGMPFLLRPSDFDVTFTDSRPPNEASPGKPFVDLFPILSQSLQLTHSLSSTHSPTEICKLLEALQRRAQDIVPISESPVTNARDLIRNIRTSMLSILLYRTQVGLYSRTLDYPETRSALHLSSTLLSPAVSLMETFTTLIQQSSTLTPSRSWTLFIPSLFRHSVYNSIGHTLHFLHRSLSDSSLHSELDSTQLFRLIHTSLNSMRVTLEVSFQCAREQTSHAIYLRYVEERYARFINQGVRSFEPDTEDGRAVVGGMCEAIDDVLRRAERALGIQSVDTEGRGEVDGQTAVGMGMPATIEGADAMNGFLPEGFELPVDWEWPWDDVADMSALDWLHPIGAGRSGQGNGAMF
ncbi:hypothetical protein ANO11243_090820 [Dothideomycetidae sp. 11243]|nr:hypothetical protein ANO11243_090820 [fungal sp. No.11243]